MDKQKGQYGKFRQNEVCDKCGQYPNEAQKYEDWVRKVNTGSNGVFVDVDLVKVKKRDNGVYKASAITDITFAKTHDIAYLNAIAGRWFQRDDQGKIFQGLSAQLGVDAYLVAYGQGKVSVLDINDPDAGWTPYELDEWARIINDL